MLKDSNYSNIVTVMINVICLIHWNLLYNIIYPFVDKEYNMIKKIYDIWHIFLCNKFLFSVQYTRLTCQIQRVCNFLTIKHYIKVYKNSMNISQRTNILQSFDRREKTTRKIRKNGGENFSNFPRHITT